MSANDTNTAGVKGTMTEQLESVKGFAERVGVTMTAKPVSANPNHVSGDDEKWAAEASHWSCTLVYSGRTMTVPFSMGAGHRVWTRSARFGDWRRPGINARPVAGARVPFAMGAAASNYIRQNSRPIPPSVSDVLGCLALDAVGYDNSRDFEDWAAGLGWDSDSRKAKRCYHATAEQSKALRHLLGDENYQALLYKTEPN